MPTVVTHAVTAAALAPVFLPPELPARRRVIAAGMICAVVPDLDVVAFRFGIPYEHMLGHRGLSHALAAAALVAIVLTLALARRAERTQRAKIAAYLFLATASHGLLDTLTNGGHGVALLAPWSGERFFAPWRPIEVSPIGIARFLSGRGLEVLASELVWVILPMTAMAFVARRLRRTQRQAAGSN